MSFNINDLNDIKDFNPNPPEEDYQTRFRDPIESNEEGKICTNFNNIIGYIPISSYYYDPGHLQTVIFIMLKVII